MARDIEELDGDRVAITAEYAQSLLNKQPKANAMNELIRAVRDVIGINGLDKGHRTVARREARQYLREWVRKAEAIPQDSGATKSPPNHGFVVSPLIWSNPNPADRYRTWRASVYDIRFEAVIDTSEPTMYGEFPLSINGRDSGEKFKKVEDAKVFAQANYAKRVADFLGTAIVPQVVQSPIDMILMPRTLTAENGAKGVLSGEFKEVVEIRCPECDYDAPDLDCEMCEGKGHWMQDVPVEWSTIKNIYRKAVECCDAPIVSTVLSGPKIYVEARECRHCQHIGINDSHEAIDACHACDWSGPSPIEDHCPGCHENGTMTAACPKCESEYRLIASSDIAAPSTAEQASDVRNDALEEAAKITEEIEIDESIRFHAPNGAYESIQNASASIRALKSATPADKGNAPAEAKS